MGLDSQLTIHIVRMDNVDLENRGSGRMVNDDWYSGRLDLYANRRKAAWVCSCFLKCLPVGPGLMVQ